MRLKRTRDNLEEQAKEDAPVEIQYYQDQLADFERERATLTAQFEVVCPIPRP